MPVMMIAPKLQNRFTLPNELYTLDLTRGERDVYSYLLYCENRKTFQCWPSYKTIGSAVGMSENTVKKYVDGLVNKRLITVEPTTIRTKDGLKRNGSLLYTIRPIREAVEYYNERQLADGLERQSEIKQMEKCNHTKPLPPPCEILRNGESSYPSCDARSKRRALWGNRE